MLHPRQLEAFRAVMLSGGIAAATELLRISQPAISRLIRNFEDSVGMKLFERVGNRLVPSDEAIMLYREVDRFYVGIDHVVKVAENIRAAKGGSIRIAMFNALETSCMNEIVAAFLARHPDISVSLEVATSRMILEFVATRSVDVGIAQIGTDSQNVDIRPLPVMRAVCVLPRHHRLADHREIHLKDLEGESIISVGRNSPLRLRTDSLLDSGGITCKRHIGTSLIGACDLCARGMGIALTDPLIAAHFQKRSGIIWRPFLPTIPIEFALIFPRYIQRTELIEEFSSLVKREIQKRLMEMDQEGG